MWCQWSHKATGCMIPVIIKTTVYRMLIGPWFWLDPELRRVFGISIDLGPMYLLRHALMQGGAYQSEEAWWPSLLSPIWLVRDGMMLFGSFRFSSMYLLMHRSTAPSDRATYMHVFPYFAGRIGSSRQYDVKDRRSTLPIAVQVIWDGASQRARVGTTAGNDLKSFKLII